MKSLLHILLAAALVLYPFWMSYSLSQHSMAWVAYTLISVGLLRFLSQRASALWPLSLLAVLCGTSAALLNDPLWLRLYPVTTSVAALAIFAATLWRPPSMIERFARLVEPDLPVSGVQWTRKVTQVWCGFFIINATIAAWTVFWGSQAQWLLYNGFISYLLMAALFTGEYLLRKRHQRLHML